MDTKKRAEVDRALIAGLEDPAEIEAAIAARGAIEPFSYEARDRIMAWLALALAPVEE
jgi:hypothetical protein